MSRRFSSHRWKLTASHAGVATLTALALEMILFVIVGVFGPWAGNAWIERTARRRAKTLAASIAAALEARSPEHLMQAVDKPAGLFPRILSTEQWDEAHVVIGMGGHVVTSNQPDCYPGGSSFLEPGLREAEIAVEKALQNGSASSRVADDLGLYLTVLPLTSSEGAQLGVLYYRQPVLTFASRRPRRLLGPLLATTAVVLPCAILSGLALGAIAATRFMTATGPSLASGDVDSPDKERPRRARQLRDSIQRRFFGLNLATASALNLLDGDPEAARAKLLEAREHSREAQTEMASWLGEIDVLGSDDAGDRDFVAALADCLSTYEQQQDISVRWQPVDHVALPPTHKEALLSVAQEALAHIARHAEAKQVTVELDATDETVTLRIVDDGQGFDLAAAKRGTETDLRGPGERLAELGGTYTVGTAPGAGTRIIATLPRV